MPKAKFKTDQEWMDAIQSCRTSGMTDKEWCHNNGISQTSLYRHIRKLKKKDYTIPGHSHVRLDERHEIVPVDLCEIGEPETTYNGSLTDAGKADISISGNLSSGIHVTTGKFRIDIDNDVNTSVLRDTLKILQKLC